MGASMTPQTVRLVIVGLAQTAGLEASRFSAHSLRSGLATQAAVNGATEAAIMRQTGHKSVAMVRRYAALNPASVFANKPHYRLRGDSSIG